MPNDDSASSSTGLSTSDANSSSSDDAAESEGHQMDESEAGDDDESENEREDSSSGSDYVEKNDKKEEEVEEETEDEAEEETDGEFEEETEEEEEKGEEEEEEQDEEKQEENDTTKLQWIFDDILELEEIEIGICHENNKTFQAMCKEMGKIRKEKKPEDYNSISDAIAAFVKKGEYNEVFSNFRSISGFIMHIHRLYDVKLNRNDDNANDALLLETMDTTFRKFMNHFVKTEKPY
jgi:hypothetical protein